MYTVGRRQYFKFSIENFVEDLFTELIGWRMPLSFLMNILQLIVVYNIAIDSAIVGLVIGVRFIETLSRVKQPLESWGGISGIETIICSFCSCMWSAFGYIHL